MAHLRIGIVVAAGLVSLTVGFATMDWSGQTQRDDATGPAADNSAIPGTVFMVKDGAFVRGCEQGYNCWDVATDCGEAADQGWTAYAKKSGGEGDFIVDVRCAGNDPEIISQARDSTADSVGEPGGVGFGNGECSCVEGGASGSSACVDPPPTHVGFGRDPVVEFLAAFDNPNNAFQPSAEGCYMSVLRFLGTGGR